jgi:hypothetical protein
MNMNMLDMSGGREREMSEFDALFGAASFRQVRGFSGLHCVVRSVGW